MTLQPVDGIEILVLVDNCLDSLSSVPKHVSLEWPRLMRNGMKELSGEAQCCANHGLSLLITARRGTTSHVLMFEMLRAWVWTSRALKALSFLMDTGIMPEDCRQRFAWLSLLGREVR
jgi:hypothetical protein